MESRPATCRAVEQLQGEQSLVRHGAVGPNTWSALLAAQPLVRLERGRSVQELQQLLVALGFDPGPLDGMFGPLTDNAFARWKGNHRLEIDGVCGRHMWAMWQVGPG